MSDSPALTPNRQITVTEHLLLHQTKSPAATGIFTRLLYDLILAAKLIARSVNKAGLLDVLGGTGEVNVQGEKVQKLDDFANRILIHRRKRSGALCAMASEENADISPIPDRFVKGDYILIFDPLDGSSNIDVDINVGTIFSILRRVSPSEQDNFERRVAARVQSGGRRLRAVRSLNNAYLHNGTGCARVYP